MQLKYHMVTIEDLVPQEHFLRKLEHVLDMSVVQEETAHLYSRKYGRPPIDPVVMVKYLLVGFLYGIPPERQIEQRIQTDVALRWYLGLDQLHEASKKSPPPRRGKRVWLVCGETSMYTGLDGLLGIIRYQLNRSPYDGNLYVFRDLSGSMIKYLEWDGAGFCLSKRRAQSGSYPWPPAEAGKVLEITEKEFEYLKSRSIVPCKEKKPR